MLASLLLAGVSLGTPQVLPLARFRSNMEVNYFGTVRMCHAFLPMVRACKGRVIFMGSIGPLMGSAFGCAYLSTKAAMMSFAQCLRQELHRFGVRVCTVEPGFFATGLLNNGLTNGAAVSDRAAECDEEVLRSYPDYSTKMSATTKPIRLCEWLNGGVDGVSKVADCVLDATLARYPLAQYTVGWDAVLIRHVLSRLPTWLVDHVQTLQG